MNVIIDIITEKRKEIKKTNILFIFKNKKINGIVPITDDKNIFLMLVILVNRTLNNQKNMSKKELTLKVNPNLYKRKSCDLRHIIYYAQLFKMFTLFYFF